MTDPVDPNVLPSSAESLLIELGGKSRLALGVFVDHDKFVPLPYAQSTKPLRHVCGVRVRGNFVTLTEFSFSEVPGSQHKIPAMPFAALAVCAVASAFVLMDVATGTAVLGLVCAGACVGLPLLHMLSRAAFWLGSRKLRAALARSGWDRVAPNVWQCRIPVGDEA